VAHCVEHCFNGRYGPARRDVYLLCTETGWQVLGRQGGADDPEVTRNYFDREDEVRRMLRRMSDTVPPELSNWAEMTLPKER
jgi:hypothetical protein